MNPVAVSAWLCLAIAALAFAWGQRHCIQHPPLQKWAVCIIGSAALMFGFSQWARVSEALKSMPGNVQGWLLVAMLSGFALLLASMTIGGFWTWLKAKALERKR